MTDLPIEDKRWEGTKPTWNETGKEWNFVVKNEFYRDDDIRLTFGGEPNVLGVLDLYLLLVLDTVSLRPSAQFGQSS